MLKIAICDDNLYFLEELERLTMELSHQISSALVIGVEQFADGSVLVDKIRNGSRYDLIMLDWDMPIMNGEATGQAIRLFDRACLIIFITAYSEYALNATRLTTFRYILKVHLKKDLPEALRSAYDKQLFDEKLLTVMTEQKGVVYLKIRDIIYIESHTNQNTIYTKQGQYHMPSRAFLKDHAATLLECSFVKPYKGFLVNVREIQELKKMDLRMSNEKQVPMSRNYHKNVMIALHHQLERYL